MTHRLRQFVARLEQGKAAGEMPPDDLILCQYLKAMAEDLQLFTPPRVADVEQLRYICCSARAQSGFWFCKPGDARARKCSLNDAVATTAERVDQKPTDGVESAR